MGNDPETLSFIRKTLFRHECDVSDCFSVEKAIGILEFGKVDMVVSEMEMSKLSGVDLLRYVKENFPDIEMMLYGRQDVETAVKAVKGGAEDYLVRPLDTEEVAAVFRKMSEKIEFRRSSEVELSVQVAHGIIGACTSIQTVFRMIEKAAATRVDGLLNVIDVTVPPLRDRKEDILFLIHHFNGKFSKEAGRMPPTFSDETLQVMKNYHWPGNVRELENLIQRLVVMADAPVVQMADMPPHLRYQIQPGEERLRPLFQVEAEHIQDVLHAVGGNKTRAAEILEIDRKTLRTKLRQWEETGMAKTGNNSPVENISSRNGA